MEVLKPNQVEKIISLLSNRKVGILPTDTIYGLHCLALDENSINRIHELKREPADKPLITLIFSQEELAAFGVVLGDFEKDQINKFWPGPNTLIFKADSGETKSFRLPDNKFLIEILKATGPLISTSANIHGEPSALSLEQAQNYFGNEVDFYVDAGEQKASSSNVYKIIEGVVEKLR